MLDITHHVAINPYPSKGEIVVLFGGEEQTVPNHKAGPWILDYYLVHYVMSGQGQFQSFGKEYSLQSGDSFFIFPGELCEYISDEHDPWRYRWVGFKGSIVDQWMSSLGISTLNPVVNTGVNRRIPALFYRIFHSLKERQANCDLLSDGYMRLLFAEYAKNTGYRHPNDKQPHTEIERQVAQAIRWLTLQYSQPISIEQMAQSLGYHRTHLSKMFKQYTGMSPMNYLLKIRMERAKLLLAGTLTIEQVSSSVGFSDPLYFSKQFKKWCGQSPTEYRNSISEIDLYDCRMR